MAENELKLPKVQKDSGKNSSLLYTVTVAIAVALFVYVITPVSNTTTIVRHVDWIRVISAIFLALSILLLFSAIDNLSDVTTFRYFYYHKMDYIKNTYKWTLIQYNVSAILITSAIILILINYLFTEFSDCCSKCTIWGIAGVVEVIVIRKLVNDIFAVVKTEVVEKLTSEKDDQALES